MTDKVIGGSGLSLDPPMLGGIAARVGEGVGERL
jgi:hypothetical protein